MSNDLFSNDNDFSSPPQPSFGTPMNQAAPKRRGGGAKIFGGLTLFGCLAILGVIFLCCACCVGAVAVALRSPSGPVVVWVGAATAGSWDIADSYICDGSQAERLTQDYQDRGVTFTSISTSQEAGSDAVSVTGVINDGGTRDWAATFITQEGDNFLGHCISEIRVTQGAGPSPTEEAP